jgi:hypothetical protein
LSKGTYLGIALDVGVGALEIQEACSVGREEECRKAKYVETVKTSLGIGFAGAGGHVGLYAAAAICLAIGVPTGGVGTVACAVIGGAVGAYAGGQVGSSAGEKTGKNFYEYMSP